MFEGNIANRIEGRIMHELKASALLYYLQNCYHVIDLETSDLLKVM